MKKVLLLQAAIVAASLIAVTEWAAFFPLPSPLIKPLLPPNKRWPSEEVAHWADSGAAPGDFRDFFARDPERIIPAGNNLVSPADGLVQEIPVRDGIAYLVIGLSFWDVHVVRTPVSGVVKDIREEGLALFRSRPDDMIFLKDKAAPVQQIVTLDTDYGEVKVRLITSYWASRLKVWVTPGQKIEKGERIGRILLGSTVVAELPVGLPLSVSPLQRVTGGETIISSGGGKP